jgi:predicted PurR-regulated permease PerM
VRDTTIGHLKAKTFTLSTDQGAGVQLRNFIVIYTQDVTYTFEYYYQQNRAELIKDEYKAFSSSIKVSPQLERTDQYLSNAKGISPSLISGVVIGVVLIGLIIFYITRRNKKLREQMER